MTMRMLIDARHREETRVAVVKGNRIEEFDFESAEHKQLKGNIYLAKVTRVEPSLQAAFVDYGGNRHGFLAFSEIHPDYYQIPREDREALLREERAHAEEEAALRADYDDEDDDHHGEDGVEVVEATHHHDDEEVAEEPADSEGDAPRGNRRKGGRGGDEAADELRRKRMALRRRYKIQDVIKRRQVLLVQVVKEERGNKGAALTTYLSLAGRYCVLMPNTSHGGGISRKISNAADRKRLKSIVAEMSLPSTMGCIVRTAGLQRTKPEIKRDFDYLARLWDEIREKTLQSDAPALIHNDSDLIKRAIRDIYNKDIEEVIVEGAEGYKAARDFMKLLMPSHVRRVTQYADPISLFQRASVEDQLAAMYNPVVQLKSGGYLVINPTEALVSIDVNSGRSTREHNIEDTALKTNMEAAEEVARQLRLRDLAGLVVIDFIDMDEKRNNRSVERKLKECLKNDRARIQLGRISHFGLMEMSRQRIRTGVLESSTEVCPHCGGTGHVRSSPSVALQVLRAAEDTLQRSNAYNLVIRTRAENALYVLNHKRAHLHELEERFGVVITIAADASLTGLVPFAIDRGEPVPNPIPLPRPPELVVEPEDLEPVEAEELEVEEEEAPREGRPQEAPAAGEQPQGDGRRRRRRRRRRRGGGQNAENGENGSASGENGQDNGGAEFEDDGEDGDDNAADVTAEAPVAGEAAEQVVVLAETAAEPVEAPATEAAPAAEAPPEDEKPRRGRRGGRRTRKGEAEAVEAAAPAEAVAEVAAEAAPADAEVAAETPKPEPKPRRRRSTVRESAPVVAVEAEPAPATPAEPVAVEPAIETPAPEAAAPAPAEEVAPVETPAEAAPAQPAPAPEPDRPRRTGWWQRKIFGE